LLQDLHGGHQRGDLGLELDDCRGMVLAIFARRAGRAGGAASLFQGCDPGMEAGDQGIESLGQGPDRGQGGSTIGAVLAGRSRRSSRSRLPTFARRPLLAPWASRASRTWRFLKLLDLEVEAGFQRLQALQQDRVFRRETPRWHRSRLTWLATTRRSRRRHIGLGGLHRVRSGSRWHTPAARWQSWTRWGGTRRLRAGLAGRTTRLRGWPPSA